MTGEGDVQQRIALARASAPREVTPFPDVALRSRQWRERNKAARLAAVQEALAVPAPRQVATETDPAEPYVPRGVRTVTNLLERTDGWRWRLTRAAGPRLDARGNIAEADCATLCVAAVGPDGRRLLWTWRWLAHKQEWKFEDAIDYGGGGMVASTTATAIVKGQAS